MPDIPQREKNSIFKGTKKSDENKATVSDSSTDVLMEENSPRRQDTVTREQIQVAEEQSNIFIRILNSIYEIIMGRSKEPQTVDTVKVQHNDINKKSDQQIYKKEPEQEKTNKKQKEEIVQGLDISTNSNGKELEYKPVENKIEVKNEVKGFTETVFPQVQVEPQPQKVPEVKKEIKEDVEVVAPKVQVEPKSIILPEIKREENKQEIKKETKEIMETVFPQVQVEPKSIILPEIKGEEIKTEEKLKDEPERVFVENKEPINTKKINVENSIINTMHKSHEYDLNSEWAHSLKRCAYFDDDSINISHTRWLLDKTDEVNSFISYLQTENTKAGTKKYSAEEICTNIGIIGSILSNQDVIDKNIDRDMLKKTCIEYVKNVHLEDNLHLFIPAKSLVHIYNETDDEKLRENINKKLLYTHSFSARMFKTEEENSKNCVVDEIISKTALCGQIANSDGILLDTFKKGVMDLNLAVLLNNSQTLESLSNSKACKEDETFGAFINDRIELSKDKERVEKIKNETKSQWVNDLIECVDNHDNNGISNLLSNKREVEDFIYHLDYIRKDSRDRDDYSTQTLPDMKVVTTILSNMDKLDDTLDKDNVKKACLGYIKDVKYYHQMPKDLLLDCYSKTKDKEVQELITQKIFSSPMETKSVKGDQTQEDTVYGRVATIFRNIDKLDQIVDAGGPLVEEIKENLKSANPTFLLQHEEEFEKISNSKLCENDKKFNKSIKKKQQELNKTKKRFENKLQSKWVKSFQTENSSKQKKLLKNDAEVQDFVGYLLYTKNQDHSKESYTEEILPKLQVMTALVSNSNKFRPQAEEICLDYLKSLKYSDQLPKDLLASMYPFTNNQELKEVIAQKMFHPEIREDVPNKEQAQKEAAKESYVAILKNLSTVTAMQDGPLEKEFKNYFTHVDTDQKIFKDVGISLCYLQNVDICRKDKTFEAYVSNKVQQETSKQAEMIAQAELRYMQKQEAKRENSIFRKMFKKFAKKDHGGETVQPVEVIGTNSSKDIDEVIEIPDDINTRAGVHKDKSMKVMSTVNTGENAKNTPYEISGHKKQKNNGMEI